ncbi:MAG: hemolysin family protein [Bacteroidota bacterium]
MTVIFLAILTLSLSFFFSGTEIAFFSASRLKIELKTLQGNRAAGILSKFTKNPSEVIITILVGNTLALVVFTRTMESLLAPALAQGMGLTQDSAYFLYTLTQTLISTLVILIFAEYIPKAIFRSNSDRLIYPATYVLNVFHRLFIIVVKVINASSKFLLRWLFRLKTHEGVVELGKKDLDQYIQGVIAAGEETSLSEVDAEMLTNALALKETKARECMIPRTDIKAASIDTPVEEMIDLFIDSQLSKIILYDDSLDEIKGFVHSNSMFLKPETIRPHIQPVLIVPESMPADVLIAELTGNQRSVAVVVDEFGGTSGMITLEDLVEEVFGEIEDEHDEEVVEEDMTKQELEANVYLLGARLAIDDLNEEFDLELPEEEYYTTLGGLVMYVAEEIPEEEAIIDVGKYKITVIKASSNRVITVKLEPGDDD